MKNHIINSINALFKSQDPISSRFCYFFAESMNKSAISVLNESSGIPDLPPQALQSPYGIQQPVQNQYGNQQTSETIIESITNKAAAILG
jgi:hypothetical protein